MLREDISYLGNILGEVIKEQEGIKFFNLVEKVRKLSKANKINLKNKNSFKKLVKTVEKVIHEIHLDLLEHLLIS